MILEELPVECADSQFLRADQSVIIGYAKNVSIVESLEECATQCLKERFPCKVITHQFNPLFLQL